MRFSAAVWNRLLHNFDDWRQPVMWFHAMPTLLPQWSHPGCSPTGRHSLYSISSLPSPLLSYAALRSRVSPYFRLLAHSEAALPRRNPFLSCAQIMEHHSSGLVWQHAIAPAWRESLKKCWAEKRSFIIKKKKIQIRADWKNRWDPELCFMELRYCAD